MKSPRNIMHQPGIVVTILYLSLGILNDPIPESTPYLVRLSSRPERAPSSIYETLQRLDPFAPSNIPVTRIAFTNPSLNLHACRETQCRFLDDAYPGLRRTRAVLVARGVDSVGELVRDADVNGLQTAQDVCLCGPSSALSAVETYGRIGG